MRNDLPRLIIKGKELKVPIVQGGMGVGVSMHRLAGAVAGEGGAGTLSSACVDKLVSKRNGKKMNMYDSVYEEVSLAKASGGVIGVNIMMALAKSYPVAAKASIDAGADYIVSGAGLPLGLPGIQKPGDTALIPIVSSARALSLICKKWERYSYRPDAVVLEGPLAGGHLGFKYGEEDLEENRLENLFGPVKDLAMKLGDFPVIVAGGIYTHEDILNAIKMGADGVQMGTRFLATDESDATQEYKQAVVEAKKEDIIIAKKPASPCGLPFRVLRYAPMFVEGGKRKAKCNKGYLLRRDQNGEFTICPAKESNEDYFCICNGLLSSAGYQSDKEKQLYTVGTNAHRVDKILSVKTLMDELTGE